eukprot:SAG11_NODE_681_length_7772_cov_26.403362_7_plen_82_part_00
MGNDTEPPTVTARLLLDHTLAAEHARGAGGGAKTVRDNDRLELGGEADGDKECGDEHSLHIFWHTLVEGEPGEAEFDTVIQ